jgi:deazaflavin-dependent oxidoreductase (nitroreductase family)
MPFPRVLANGRVNEVLLRFAGHAAFADLEHVGRKSGAVRHTPVRAFRRQDKVVIGINFGRQSDWVKNVQAAGGCRMRLAGERLELGEPRIIPVAEGIRSMPRLFGFALRRVVHTAECVELSVISSRPVKRDTLRPSDRAGVRS